MLNPDILIIGGTGKVGRELVKAFSNSDIPVRMVSRNPAILPFVGSNFELVNGDLDHPLTIKPALRGIKRIFLLSADHPDQAVRENALIELAAKEGVTHIVKASAFVAGLQPPASFGKQLHLVEEKLKASGMSWTLLRPFVFMQNFLAFAELIKSKGLVVAPFGNARIGFVDTRDVAAVAFAALTEDGHEDKVYELSGPEALTFQEAVNKMSAIINKKLRYIPLPGLIAKLALPAQGVPKWNANMLVELGQVLKKGGEDKVTDTIERITQKKPYSFQEFVEHHKQHFVQ